MPILNYRTIDRRKRLIIAMDAAFGMEYLHGKNIVHFDLKSHNFLVNMRDPHRPVCKVIYLIRAITGFDSNFLSYTSFFTVWSIVPGLNFLFSEYFIILIKQI